MAVDLAGKPTKDLETIVANGRRLNRPNYPRCLAASTILEARRNGDYNVEKTVAAICEHGRQRHFLSYKDVATASGLEWTNVLRQINRHLEAVCLYLNDKGWPLLPAIVVNQKNLASGELTSSNRKGFLDAAREAGRTVDIEPLAFIAREQQRVFDWCQTEGQ